MTTASANAINDRWKLRISQLVEIFIFRMCFSSLVIVEKIGTLLVLAFLESK